jgi:hypothetical protein
MARALAALRAMPEVAEARAMEPSGWPRCSAPGAAAIPPSRCRA